MLREDTMRRTILAALAVLIAGAGPVLAADKLKVAIPQKGFWDSSWVEFGEAAGFFKDAGLEIEAFYTEGGAQTIATVASGSVDIAMSNGIAGAIGAYVKGGDATPYRVIGAEMTGAHELFWWVKADSPIKSLKDADGKTIAFSSPGSSSNLILLTLLKQYGSKAKPTPTGGVPGTYTQTMTGQIDIGWSAAPFALGALQEKRIRSVANIADIPEYRALSVRFHLAHLNFITGRPDVLKRFLAAYAETIDWMYKGDEPIEVFSKLYGVKPAEMRQTRNEFYTRESMDIRRVGGLDQSNEDAVAYKFIAKPLTKAELDDLFKYQPK
jgi:NitT/TauT family transport system substrate-binding protein